jgi:hypothetical protein
MNAVKSFFVLSFVLLSAVFVCSHDMYLSDAALGYSYFISYDNESDYYQGTGCLSFSTNFTGIQNISVDVWSTDFIGANSGVRVFAVQRADNTSFTSSQIYSDNCHGCRRLINLSVDSNTSIFKLCDLNAYTNRYYLSGSYVDYLEEKKENYYGGVIDSFPILNHYDTHTSYVTIGDNTYTTTYLNESGNGGDIFYFTDIKIENQTAFDQILFSTTDGNSSIGWRIGANFSGTTASTTTTSTTFIDVAIVYPAANDSITSVSVPILVNVSSNLENTGFMARADFSCENGSIQLYDDGSHGDQLSGDNLFGNNWTPQSYGNCTITIQVNSSQTVGTGNVTIELRKPDLYISPDDINFWQELPKPGEYVNITSTIHNSGARDAENASVSFYDHTTDSVLGWPAIPFIAANGSVNRSIEWHIAANETVGPHNVNVTVHLDNPNDRDEDGTNDQALKEITIYTKRVLVSLSYYNDENQSDIEIYEPRLKSYLKKTEDYFLNQSYHREYIGFSDPKYVKLSFDSTHYQDSTDDGNYYTSSRSYSNHVLTALRNQGIDPSGYDAVIGYESDIEVFSGEESYRAVTYKDLHFSALNIDNEYPVFSHELGHALYNFGDFYSSYGLFCAYNGECRGNLLFDAEYGNGWDIMAQNSYPRPITSFNRIFAGWANHSPYSINGPEYFELDMLGNMTSSSHIITLENVTDKETGTVYTFILEARDSIGTDEIIKNQSSVSNYSTSRGIIIYQDKPMLVGRWLEPLKPMYSNDYVGKYTNTPQKPDPTLTSNFNKYFYPGTGLEFEYLGQNSSSNKLEIKITPNVSKHKNMSGMIMYFKNINSSSSLSGFSPPPRPCIINDLDFFNCDFSGSDSGQFDLTLQNGYTHFRIDSITASSFDNQSCNVSTPMPIYDSSKTASFTGWCPFVKSKKPVKMTLCLNYDILSDNGSLEQANVTRCGSIKKTEKGNNDSGFIFYVILALLILILLLLIFSGRIKIVIVLLIFLPLSYIFSYMPVTFLEPNNSESQNVSTHQVFSPIFLTWPQLDLHAYTADGLHTGMNYTTGVYENQISGAIASGDMVAEEWIFVPSNLDVHFVVDSHDVRQYLDEINSTENMILNYNIQQMMYGPNPSVEIINGNVVILDRFVSELVNDSIGPGETVVYTMPLGNCFFGGVGICGTEFCCGASDNVCPTDFEGITCGVSDPDCSCSYGGISICGNNFCCGTSDGVCPSSFEGISCSAFDVDCV